MLKKRGVLKWKKIAQRTVFVTNTLEKHRQNQLRKMFDGWWNNVDRLSAGKSRYIMQVELSKRFQYRRVLTSLKLHCEAKQHLKDITRVFRIKHDMIEKARVFSAIIR